ncbi:MAG TPA: polymer-forming cytoskeletal protein [Polyangiaceae bacterium]|jgi:cytoskeletal protein CcmA (bactofilin family)|nr:polymer-forming cytoskeletal protein [Polyangiaceae bacterium]
MNRSQHELSVLGPATRVTGRINGAGALRVEGSVKGDVSVHGETEIADGGSVEGNLHGDTIEISGKLLGDAEAEGAIAVRSSAHVRGQLRGAEVSIEPGARVSVRLETEFELDFGAQRRAVR